MKIDWQTIARLNEFDWLFTSFFLFLVVAAPVAAVLRPDNAETLGRAHYFLRMLALIVLAYAVTALVTLDPFHIAGRLYFLVNLDFMVTDFSLFTLWKLCVVVTYYVQTRWTVCRIREAGRFSIWWALLMALPTISLLLVPVFALIPPRVSQSAEQQSDDSRDEEPALLLRAS